MIYHFTGNSHFLIDQQVSAWKNKFIEKYGEFNLVVIKDIGEYDHNFLIENISASSLFAEKKLVIIQLEIGSKDTKIAEKTDFIIQQLNNIPEGNIILFYSVNPDKRSKQYKSINKLAELKEFHNRTPQDTFGIIKNKYLGKISDNALQTLIIYKSNNIEKINSEIEKLLITISYIEIDHIKQHILPELEESIFQFIDYLLNGEIVYAKKVLNIILQNTNIYAFYNNLLANLRTSVYIQELKSKKVSKQEIISLLNLGNKGFLVDKRYKLNYQELKKLYINLIYLDKKMKSGKLLGTDDKDFQLEFEQVLLQSYVQ